VRECPQTLSVRFSVRTDLGVTGQPLFSPKGWNKPAQGLALVVPHKFQVVLANWEG
jgi:hypothetical protein